MPGTALVNRVRVHACSDHATFPYALCKLATAQTWAVSQTPRQMLMLCVWLCDVGPQARALHLGGCAPGSGGERLAAVLRRMQGTPGEISEVFFDRNGARTLDAQVLLGGARS